jgi:HD domain-containing protein
MGGDGTLEELVPGFSAESRIERVVTRDPVLLEGLAWGRPRGGHPEGSVGAHVADLLGTLDEWGEPEPRRSELRFIALVHDAFKYRVRNWLPKTGENHHAMRARRFAERYTSDERLLAAIELHDRPYAIWRRMRRTGRLDERAFARMLDRIPDPELFLRFVELDSSPMGKKPEPVRWLREELRRRGALEARR